MKKLCFLLLFGAAACTQQPTDHFILRGTVPGVMDSTKVTLRTVTRWDKDLASAYVIDGKFELRGQLDAPTLCKLSLNNARSYELDFFVENGKLTFTTPHIELSGGRFHHARCVLPLPTTNPSVALRHTGTPQAGKSNPGL